MFRKPKSTQPPTNPVNMSTHSLTAPLVEVFSAIQGEGLNVGTRQLFIRFGGCDLRCTYCDSAHTWRSQPTALIEQHPGHRDFTAVPNPATIPQLLDWLHPLLKTSLHDSFSLTGGEPLLHAEFLAQLLPALRDRFALPIYLETGGHHPEALILLLPYLDLIGMDLKLPSVSGEEHWQAHREFLGHCVKLAQPTIVFCKLIVSQATTQADLDQAQALIAEIHPAIPVILQPVTPLGGSGEPVSPTPAQVLQWQAAFKTQLQDVRVIPQTHKMINQR